MTRLALLIVCTGLAGHAAACSCRHEAPAGAWNFEDDCVDATCGFRAASGTATRVSTLSTGEHGMQLSAGAIVTRTAYAPWRGPSIGFLGWCDHPGRLNITVVVQGDGGTETMSTRVTLSTTWYDVTGVLGRGSIAPEGIASITIENQTDGRCVLDTITIGNTRSACQ